MKSETGLFDKNASNIFLTGCILLANLDFSGLLDYGLKAVLGGAIWLGYKAAADYLAERKKRKREQLPPRND